MKIMELVRRGQVATESKRGLSFSRKVAAAAIPVAVLAGSAFANGTAYTNTDLTTAGVDQASVLSNTIATVGPIIIALIGVAVLVGGMWAVLKVAGRVFGVRIKAGH